MFSRSLNKCVEITDRVTPSYLTLSAEALSALYSIVCLVLIKLGVALPPLTTTTLGPYLYILYAKHQHIEGLLPIVHNAQNKWHALMVVLVVCLFWARTHEVYAMHSTIIFQGFGFCRKLARTKTQQGTDKASEHNGRTIF